MRGRWGAAGLAGLLLLAGCGPAGGGGSRVGANLVDGIRTDPDQRGLVVAYTGGECDGPAHLQVTETAARIDADVVLGRGHGGACGAVGYLRTLTARLEQPVGAREVWSGGRRQVPFDGARLLAPTSLPAAFTGVQERGSAFPATEAPAPSVTTLWVVTRFDPASRSADGACHPGRGFLEIHLGPRPARWSRGHQVGTVDVGSRKADLFRSGRAARPTSWALAWTAGRRSVVVQSGGDCEGDQILGRAELLQVARSLRSP